MTTPARLLADKVIPGSYRLRNVDNSDRGSIPFSEVVSLIEAGKVEGIGPPSGYIKVLRLTDPQYMPVVKKKAEPSKEQPGSIISGASKEVFREGLGNCMYVWQHKANRGLSFASSR